MKYLNVKIPDSENKININEQTNEDIQNLNNEFLKFDDLFKIPLLNNSKLPVYKGWQKKENQLQNITNNKFNIGISTGIINNIIVLDIDTKDEGIEEFNKYILKYGEPHTVKQKTQSGGFHYVFKYGSIDKDNNFLIKNYLKNSSKYRNKGLDIRAEGGFFCSFPSIINGNKYKYVNNFNDVPVSEMPRSLILWLLNGDIHIKTQNAKEKKIFNFFPPNLEYIITDEKIKYILSLLPDEYLNNYNEWFIVLSVLKNLNKIYIFDEFSKKGNNYNYNNNKLLWNCNEGRIDINYLIFILNKTITDKNKTN